jgi:rod shape determining protein RodA
VKSSIFEFSVDYTFMAFMLLLVLVGLVCLYSSTVTGAHSLMNTEFGKQLIWFFSGCVIIFCTLLIPPRILYQFAYLLYIIALILLIAVIFRGRGPIHRWLHFGNFQFQPSELAKVATLLALSRYLSEERGFKLSQKQLIIAICLVFFPFLLVLKEPDIGTASVFLSLLGGMVIWAGIDIKTIFLLLVPLGAFISGFHLVSFIGFMLLLVVGFIITKQRWWAGLGIGSLCFGLGLFAPIIWSTVETYQKQRLLIFLGMKSDPLGAAYQVIQSKVAIGSGGILGKGFLNGSQTHLRFLPEQHTDFIFSVLGEEFGFMGSMVVILLFLALLIRGVVTAKRARTRFESYISIGCVMIIGYHVIVNIGMTLGILPVTGLPLPFFSYGGTFLWISMILIGFLANISGRLYEY